MLFQYLQSDIGVTLHCCSLAVTVTVTVLVLVLATFCQVLLLVLVLNLSNLFCLTLIMIVQYYKLIHFDNQVNQMSALMSH